MLKITVKMSWMFFWDTVLLITTLCPQKSFPDIFDCNLKINYQNFENFWYEYF